MRVLIILKYIPSPDNHEKSDLLLSTIIGHENQGCDVVLLSTGAYNKHRWDQIDTTFSFIEKFVCFSLRLFSRKARNSFRENRIVHKVKQYHKNKKIDIVFAECTANHPGIHAVYIKEKLGIPYVLREHKNYETSVASVNKIPKNYLKALRAADRLAAVSPLSKNIMQSKGVRDDIICIPNGLSDEFFDAPYTNRFREKYGNDSFVFASWTRWRKIKRIDLLLQAFKEIHLKNPNTTLVVAGRIEPPENEEWVNHFILKNDLAHCVVLLGHISRSEIHHLAHFCDCCVLPSDYETFGLQALEAMAAGKPVVTTRCNGPEFLVSSDAYGKTTERGSVDQLVNAMFDIIQNKESFNSKFIRSETYKQFSRTAVSRLITTLYNEILDKKDI